MDLKKEIKLSDLFRRPAPPAAAGKEEPVEETASGRTGFLTKDVTLSFRRRDKDAKAPKAPKAPKQPKEPKGAKEREAPREKRRGKQASPVPSIPLMRAFNLLPKEDLRQAKGRRPSAARLALAVAAIVLIGALGSYFVVLSGSVAAKKDARNDLQSQLAALNVSAEEPKRKETEADPALVEERQKRTAALATALGSRVAWDRLLRGLSLVLPEDVWLKTLTATAPPKQSAGTPAPPPAPGAAAPGSVLTLGGYTKEQDGVARLLARLSVLPELASVQLLSSTRVTIGEEEVVEFAITATVRTPSGATA